METAVDRFIDFNNLIPNRFPLLQNSPIGWLRYGMNYTVFGVYGRVIIPCPATGKPHTPTRPAAVSRIIPMFPIPVFYKISFTAY
jgi:hypothetical protein